MQRGADGADTNASATETRIQTGAAVRRAPNLDKPFRSYGLGGRGVEGALSKKEPARNPPSTGGPPESVIYAEFVVTLLWQSDIVFRWSAAESLVLSKKQGSFFA